MAPVPEQVPDVGAAVLPADGLTTLRVQPIPNGTISRAAVSQKPSIPHFEAWARR
jgi:hypothetical protein